jgi:hypothetical protein
MEASILVTRIFVGFICASSRYGFDGVLSSVGNIDIYPLNDQVGGSIIYPRKWLDASFNGCYKSMCFGLGIGSP